ncbi:NAD(P)-binding domain-containing protein [Bradyrhizobium sp. 76]|uniref:NAD(P)-binding domain-containing protein n=1 Tax=Bradyrhizobium sp. 76 TaxID=2782680 RepID=UPI001FF97A47|nr:NAD(P)-binding domain-containing protein [Bradyrhizobium sp. 76]MCK1409431.1 NAD(P)-binding domain-containing protein [Bradyrhizobium sp. 76]
MGADKSVITPAIPLYLNSGVVQQCLTDEEIFDAVSRTLRESSNPELIRGVKSGFRVDIDGEHLHMGNVSACVLSSSVAGTKWFVVSPNNASRNLERIQATILVSDAVTGRLQGILDGKWLTSQRTAAMAVAAVAACGRHPISNATVIGAGAIGRALVKFLVATQPVHRVTVSSLNATSAHHACESATEFVRGGVTLCATSDVQGAVKDADVVFTATGVPGDTDVVCAQWLKDSAIVCSVGSHREVDMELITQSWIVADDIDGVKMRRGDFREGGVGWNRIVGDIGKLTSGKLRLPDVSKRIHLVLVGLGSLDVALSARAIVNARNRGVGVPLGSASE